MLNWTKEEIEIKAKLASEWLLSEEGQKEMKKNFKEVNEICNEMEERRKPTQEIMDIIIDV